jgi:hypothetical protein
MCAATETLTRFDEPTSRDELGDELSDLGAEIDDQDTVLHGGRSGESAGVCKLGKFC